MRIASILCFLALSCCSPPIESNQTCAACQTFFVEYNKLKLIATDNLSRKESDRMPLSAENLSAIQANKFCLINVPEEELLELFKDGVLSKTDNKLGILYSSNKNSNLESIVFYIKEVDGKRVHVGDKRDSFQLEQCIAMDKK